MIWLHGDALTVEYEETPLAEYTVRYQPDKKHFKAVPEAKRFETSYRSLQVWLWELDETLWHLARRLPRLHTSKETAKKANTDPIIAIGRLTSRSGVIRTSFCPLDESKSRTGLPFLLMSHLTIVGFVREEEGLFRLAHLGHIESISTSTRPSSPCSSSALIHIFSGTAL